MSLLAFARGGSRTHTTRRPRDFESRASANSATLAARLILVEEGWVINILLPIFRRASIGAKKIAYWTEFFDFPHLT